MTDELERLKKAWDDAEVAHREAIATHRRATRACTGAAASYLDALDAGYAADAAFDAYQAALENEK